jgi:hypothetical protein
MRSHPEANAINRVLKARGLGTLDESGTVAQLTYMVEDHQHFMTLLRACEPGLRREMYEAMSPHLRFRAKPLEDYIIAAKEHAAAAELPVLDEDGMLHSYMMPNIGVVELEVPEIELWIGCARCDRGVIFLGDRKLDIIHNLRIAGWAYDESAQQRHLCPQCLEEVPDAVDQASGQTSFER